jgi:hypothetical protein
MVFGVSSLPGRMPVEVELVFEVDNVSSATRRSLDWNTGLG